MLYRNPYSTGQHCPAPVCVSIFVISQQNIWQRGSSARCLGERVGSTHLQVRPLLLVLIVVLARNRQEVVHSSYGWVSRKYNKCRGPNP